MLGIFFMALTLAIVSFSCTGPILGSLLAGSLTAEGGAQQLTAGMAGFGVALALPFALFALFPNALKMLPKSGAWMNTIKVVLGFLELALALKFLSNADLVFSIVRPEVKVLKLLKKSAVLICQMEAHINPKEIKECADMGITSFALEQVPRISRAQSI